MTNIPVGQREDVRISDLYGTIGLVGAGSKYDTITDAAAENDYVIVTDGYDPSAESLPMHWTDSSAYGGTTIDASAAGQLSYDSGGAGVFHPDFNASSPAESMSFYNLDIEDTGPGSGNIFTVDIPHATIDNVTLTAGSKSTGSGVAFKFCDNNTAFGGRVSNIEVRYFGGIGVEVTSNAPGMVFVHPVVNYTGGTAYSLGAGIAGTTFYRPALNEVDGTGWLLSGTQGVTIHAPSMEDFGVNSTNRNTNCGIVFGGNAAHCYFGYVYVRNGNSNNHAVALPAQNSGNAVTVGPIMYSDGFDTIINHLAGDLHVDMGKVGPEPSASANANELELGSNAGLLYDAGVIKAAGSNNAGHESSSYAATGIDPTAVAPANGTEAFIDAATTGGNIGMGLYANGGWQYTTMPNV